MSQRWLISWGLKKIKNIDSETVIPKVDNLIALLSSERALKILYLDVRLITLKLNSVALHFSHITKS